MITLRTNQVCGFAFCFCFVSYFQQISLRLECIPENLDSSNATRAPQKIRLPQ